MELSWNSVWILMTNCRRFARWNDMEFPWGPISHFLQGLYINNNNYTVNLWRYPWKRFDMGSRGISTSFHVTNWKQFGPNPHQIQWLSRFYLFFMLEHDMDFGLVQVMEFSWHLLRKWVDFHRFWSHFRPNCRQKDTRKSLSHFL